MPIYEYVCSECRKRSEIITFRVSESFTPSCRHCGSGQMERVVSRVRVRLSEETRMERMADPSRLGGLDENDPKSMALWMKNVSREMGDDFGGDIGDIDQMVDEAMAEEHGAGAGEESGGAGDD
jgi:putative FmdB family regulatory protein